MAKLILHYHYSSLQCHTILQKSFEYADLPLKKMSCYYQCWIQLYSENHSRCKSPLHRACSQTLTTAGRWWDRQPCCLCDCIPPGLSSAPKWPTSPRLPLPLVWPAVFGPFPDAACVPTASQPADPRGMKDSQGDRQGPEGPGPPPLQQERAAPRAGTARGRWNLPVDTAVSTLPGKEDRPHRPEAALAPPSHDTATERGRRKSSEGKFTEFTCVLCLYVCFSLDW